MKPLLLTLQALGPYAGKEVVDFRPAMDSGLFGIYGKTGSGKSTLFSAISFCLFGEPAHAEQEQASLRSHHAVADLPTKVELIFALGQKQYLVRRWPTQTRPKKKGEGEITERSKADLFDVTGLNVSEINEENSGKVIKETKVKEVDAAVENILGYGAKQFKQIVLLPQGRFETFLTAKTADRITILRDLFDVFLYKAMAEDMHEQAKAADESVRSERRLCSQLLLNKGFETTDELIIGIETAAAAAEEQKKLAEQANKDDHIQQGLLSHAKQLAATFTARDAVHKLMVDLQNNETEIETLRVNKAQAENARLLLGPETERQRCQNQHQSAITAVTDCQSKIAAAQQTLETRQDRIIHFLTTAPQHKQNTEWLADLKKHEARLKTANIQKAELGQKEAQLTTDNTAITQHDENYSRLTAALTQRRAALGTEQAKDIKIAQLNTDIAVTQAALNAAQNYEAAQSEITGLENTISHLSVQIDTAKDHATECETRFNLAEQKLSGIQALILANKLVAGQSCSVCGSKDHPAPAHGTPERQGLNTEFEQAEASRKTANSRLATLTAEHQVKSSSLEQKRLNIKGEAVPASSASAIALSVSDLQGQLQAFPKTITVDDIQKDIGEKEGELQRLSQIRIGLSDAQDASKSAFQLAQQAVTIALSEIPEDLREPDVLASHLNKLVETTEAYDTQYEAAKTAFGLAQKDATLCAERLTVAISSEKAAKITAENAQGQWEAELTKLNMQADHFEIWKTHIPHISSYLEQIKNHDAALIHSQGQIASLEKTIAGKVKPELDFLEQSAAETKNHAATANREATLAEAHSRDLLKLRNNLQEQLDSIEKMEQAAGPVKNLAAAFNGTLGPKMTLETFAIAAMFDRVLDAANMRLLPMSKGRFTFQRETSGKGAAKRGLDIRVFDVQTGTQRATTTLSGGEKFIHALALALGLSEVVESLSGNVRLDTIFIDEGFGSLDAEDEAGTLGDVLQTLTTLVGANRSVGLISHVEIVKQEIPSGFYISSLPSGSSIIESKLI